jgi:hypothetical protein
MPTPGNSFLLDTSVVVKHFRYPTAVVDKLAEYEELFAATGFGRTLLRSLPLGSARKKPSSEQDTEFMSNGAPTVSNPNYRIVQKKPRAGDGSAGRGFGPVFGVLQLSGIKLKR